MLYAPAKEHGGGRPGSVYSGSSFMQASTFQLPSDTKICDREKDTKVCDRER